MLILANLPLFLISNGLMSHKTQLRKNSYLISRINPANKWNAKIIELDAVVAIVHMI
jgi:hypothetical protein